MKKIITLIVFMLSSFISFAQVDSLTLKNGDMIVGEIKNMEKGVIQIETPYSDSDFKIEWDGIKEIKGETYFLITTTEGQRYNGRIKSLNGDQFVLETDDHGEVMIAPDHIVNLLSVKSTFISRLSASLDVGYSYTKANNLSQFNTNGFIGYTTNRWGFTFNIASLRSTQDDVAAIERNEGTLTGNYYLPHDFYITASASYLTNTEQSINLRVIGLGGFGKYVLRTNSAYWGFSTGASFLNESFDPVFNESDSTFTTAPTRSEAEWYLGTEINLFDTGDLSFQTTAKGFRALSDQERWRADVNANLKYDLPYDFYIKASYNLNYDSQPAEAGKEIDYQYTLGFGWEL
ncbi:DUF481 domain-containing protein [Flammeovirga sp. MY04]|uniref:DUF481 domain-containing protein n=1 Tax=Flammeovirga sp. MY04 TaxID=1191459 RepID=UPI00082641AC|nr:DUF481 domain-containing protein [Flammeovirga sp. MY04]ANQ49148.2 DUF481 domain-containing protein [Flammeovirga sp. MY04]